MRANYLNLVLLKKNLMKEYLRMKLKMKKRRILESIYRRKMLKEIYETLYEKYNYIKGLLISNRIKEIEQESLTRKMTLEKSSFEDAINDYIPKKFKNRLYEVKGKIKSVAKKIRFSKLDFENKADIQKIKDNIQKTNPKFSLTNENEENELINLSEELHQECGVLEQKIQTGGQDVHTSPLYRSMNLLAVLPQDVLAIIHANQSSFIEKNNNSVYEELGSGEFYFNGSLFEV